MTNKAKEMLFSTIQDRVVNATCLAGVICKAAYTQQMNMSDMGASCEIFCEYLDRTWELTSEYQNK